MNLLMEALLKGWRVDGDPVVVDGRQYVVLKRPSTIAIGLVSPTSGAYATHRGFL